MARVARALVAANRGALLALAFLVVAAQSGGAPAPVHVVDLLMLYTSAAEAGAGGSEALQAQALAAVAEANLVFQRSGANVRVRLVNFVLIDYEESGSVAMDLERLRTPDDGYLDWAQSWRGWTDADLACLITETGSDWEFYGLQGPSAENAYSVLRRPFLTGFLSLPVVLSFNFGCQLERQFADSLSAFSFAYGYSFEANGSPVSTVEAFSGARLPFFSNPEILVGGVAAGVPPGQIGACDNTRALNLTAPMVAAFAGPAPVSWPPQVELALPSPNTRLAPGDSLHFRPRVSDSDGAVARVDYFAANRWIGSSSVSPFTFTWPATLIGHYDVFAVATDDSGASTVSENACVHCTWLNDDFENRQPLAGTDVTWPAANWFASKEPGEPDHALDAGGKSLWWSWNAPAHGTAQFSAINHGASALLAAYTGEAVDSLTAVAHNWGGWWASISFPVELGQTYQLALDGPSGLEVTSMLHLEVFPAPRVILTSPQDGMVFPAASSIVVKAMAEASDGSAPERVDFFDGDALLATLTNPPFTFVWSNAPAGDHALRVGVMERGGASNGTASVYVGVIPSNDNFESRGGLEGTNLSFGATSACSRSGKVWWTWKPPARGHVRLWAAGCDTSVYTGDAETNLTKIAWMDSWRNQPITFEAQATGEYHLAVSGNPQTGGRFNFQLQFFPSPDNDDFDHAFFISGSGAVMTGNTEGASLEPGEPSYYGAHGDSIWWRWTAPVSGDVRVFCDGAAWLHGAVYRGSVVSSLTLLSSAASTAYGAFGPLSLRAAAGSEYRLAVMSCLADRGPVNLRLEVARVTLLDPTNGARLVAPGPITLTASPDDVNHTVCRVDYLDGDTRLGSVTEPPYAFRWTNAPTGERTLRVAVVGEEGTTNVSLPVTVQIAPANDDFTNRVVLSGTSAVVTGTIIGASGETNEPPHPGYAGFHSVWYSWTAPVTGRTTLTPSGTGPILLDAFRGDSLTNLTLMARAYASPIAFDLGVGESCVIRVDGNVDHKGDFGFTLSFVPAPPDVITLTSPVDGAILRTNQTILLATATHPSVRAVSYFVDNTMLGMVTNEPFALSWTNPPAGTYSIRAQATTSILANTNTRAIAITVLPPGPANDDYASRAPLSGGSVTVTGTVAYATREAGEAAHWCWAYGGTVWWSWTAPEDGRARVTLDEPTPDRVVSVYQNVETPTPLLTNVGCGTDHVLFDVTAGRSYDIVVQQYFSGPGEFVMRIGMSKVWMTSPTNGEEFTAPCDIPLTAALTHGMSRAEFYNGTNLLGVSEGPSFAFTWTNAPLGEHILSVRAIGASGEVMVSDALGVTVRPGNDHFTNRFALETNRLTFLIHANNDTATHEATEPVTQAGSGQTLWWEWTTPSKGLLAIRSAGVFDMVQPHDPNSICWCEDWTHRVRGLETRLPVDPLLGGPLVSVYSGDHLGDLRLLTNNLVNLGWLYTLPSGYDTPWTVGPTIAVVVRQGQALQIALDGCNGASGEATLELQLIPPPGNDDFANRTAFAGSAATLTGDTSAATSEPGELVAGGASGQTLWWSWTAPADGTVTVQDVGSGLIMPSLDPVSLPGEDPSSANRARDRLIIIVEPPSDPPPAGSLNGAVFSLYSGDTFEELTLLATNTYYYAGSGIYICDGGGECHQQYPAGWYALPQLTLPVVAGQTYHVSLDGANGRFGVGTLAWAFSPKPPPPANDNFANRSIMLGSNFSIEGTTLSATRESGEPLHEQSLGTRTVWYSWTAPGSGNATVTSHVPTGTFVVAAYVGRTLTDLIPVAPPAANFAFFAREGVTYNFAAAGADGLETAFSFALTGPSSTPTLEAAAFANLPTGPCQISVPGVTGQSVILEASFDLANWERLAVDTIIGGTLQFVDADAPNYPQRFYRVRSLEAVLATEPLRIVSGSATSTGAFQVRLQGTPGWPFRLLASPDLRHWREVTNGVMPGAFECFDAGAVDSPAQFYRLAP